MHEYNDTLIKLYINKMYFINKNKWGARNLKNGERDARGYRVARLLLDVSEARVSGFGFRVYGLGVGAQGLGFRVWGLECRVKGLGFRV